MTLQELFPLNSWVTLSRNTPWAGWKARVVGYSGTTTLEVQLHLNKQGKEPPDEHVVLLSFRSVTQWDALEVLAHALDDEGAKR